MSQIAAPKAHSVAGGTAAPAVALFAVVTFLLGLQNVHAVPASSITLFMPILFVAGIVQIVLGALAVQRGDHLIGIFFCVFGPFLISFSLLVIGLIHGWWPIPPADIPHAEGGFLIGWTAMLSLWFFLSVVTPAIFTVLLALVDIALWCLVVGIWNTSSGWQTTSGWFLLASALGAGYYVSSTWLAWEGYDFLKLGRPLIQRLGVRTPAASIAIPEI